MLLLFALLPSLAIVYVQGHPGPQDRFLNFGIHELAIAVASLLGGFVTWVTWLCYRSSGEVFLRWLALGLLGFTLIYGCHGLLTRVADCNLGLFLIYGPASRLMLAFCLLIGLAQYSAPADPPEVRTRYRLWGWSVGSLLVFDLALGAAFSGPAGICLENPVKFGGGFAGDLRRGMEWTALLLTLANIVLMLVKRLRGFLMTLYVISLAAFAQSSIAFLQSKAWDHQWWLAHGIFAGGFLMLSYGVIQAFHGSQSFAEVYSLEELMRRLRRANAELEELAGTDALTGTVNRRRFIEALDRMVERRHRYGEPFSLLMIDLDHFKRINDTYGHLIGDQVLQQVAACCQARLRALDVLGRLGGEEFAILLPHTGLDEALHVAERLRNALAATPAATRAGDIHVSASIGVAEFGADQDAAGLIQAADHQLYAAKKHGRDRVEPSGALA